MVIIGLLLPLMLVGKLQSMGMYLRPLEILQAFGTSVLLHFPVAAAALVATLCLASLLPARIRARLTPMILSAGLLFALFMGARPLLDAQLGPGSYSAAAVAALLVLIGCVHGYRLPESARGALPVAALLSAGGVLAALAAILLGLGTQAPPAEPRPSAPAGRPNILIVTLDSFANAHLSSMGYPRRTTPTLDRLAAEGAQFTQLVASSNYTTPTLNTLMSGQRPWAHKAFHLKSRPLETSREQSLPAVLRRAGYAVHAVSTNPYGGLHKNGYGRFFDTVATDRMPWLTGCSDTYSRYLPFACAATEVGIIDQLAMRANLLLERLGYWPAGRHFDARIALADAEALWQRAAPGRPQFLWVHLVPPHDPYIAPPPFGGRFSPLPGADSAGSSSPLFHFEFASEPPARQALLRARYDESIAATDADVGAFLDRLRARGLLRNTILIVSADHGEGFRPDYGGHGGPMLYGGLTNIPLIITGEPIPAGQRIVQPVEQADIPATVAALAGAAAPAGWDGRSLLPLLSGGTPPPRPVFSASLERSSRFGPLRSASVAMTDGRWTYVHYRNLPDLPGYGSLHDGLYDTALDSEQTRNLAAAHPAQAAAMRKRIVAELARHGG